LVDDGIVIAENIYAHFERGKSPMRAALDGTTEVMNAVFTSVLTTVFAFSTLLFVGGEMEMMQEMAFSVIACLLFSLIEAFLILPSHLASKKIIKPNDSKFRKALNNGVKYVRDGYGRVLEKMLRRHRLHVWGPLGFIFLIAVLFNFGWIRWTFFPSIPFDSILVEFTYQPGDRETKTENFLWYCDSVVERYNQELIKKYNDTIITYQSLSVGTTENLGEYGSHVGSIRISVKENDHISTIDMSNELRAKFPEDSIRLLEKFTVGGQQRFGKEVSISLQSEESEELESAANWMKEQIASFPEVKSVLDNSGIGNRELHLELKSKAYLLGLNEMSISNQIRQGFFWSRSSKIN
jgi:multidrug efflux pump subunit AcrB